MIYFHYNFFIFLKGLFMKYALSMFDRSNYLGCMWRGRLVLLHIVDKIQLILVTSCTALYDLSLLSLWYARSMFNRSNYLGCMCRGRLVLLYIVDKIKLIFSHCMIWSITPITSICSLYVWLVQLSRLYV